MSGADGIAMNHYATHSSDDYSSVSYAEAVSGHPGFTHAAHALLYCRRTQSARHRSPPRDVNSEEGRPPYIMMIMRFDGYLGFPGGLCEEGECPEAGLNRELREEICLTDHDSVTEQDVALCHVNFKTRLCLYFFIKELPPERFRSLEVNALTAEEYGEETLGVIRIPLREHNGRLTTPPDFLMHNFIGNTKQQLLFALENLHKRP